MGSSIAWHLSSAGAGRVLVLDRGSGPGEGTSGRAMGGVRAQFGNPLNISMSLYSLEIFERFEELTGFPSGFRAAGYLLLATRREHLTLLRELAELQRAAGLLDVEELGPEEIARRVPILNVDDVLGGSFRQGDGFVDPLSLIAGFSGAAQANGTEIRYGVEVLGIEVESGSVSGVRTSAGLTATPVVVNAAGPWAREVAALAGVDLPVRPLRRQIVKTHPHPEIGGDLPMVIDLAGGLHFRPDFMEPPPHGLRVAGPDRVEHWGFDTSFDDVILDQITPWLARRAPAIADVVVDPQRCSAGLYAMSPDRHAILGPVPGLAGFHLANGFSGHGVMHAPATGRIVSETILTGSSSTFPDAAKLRLDRFAERRLLDEPAIF